MQPRFVMQHHDLSGTSVLTSPDYWDGSTLARIEILTTPWGYRLVRYSRSIESEILFFQGSEIIEMLMVNDRPCLFTDIGDAARAVIGMVQRAQSASSLQQVA